YKSDTRLYHYWLLGIAEFMAIQETYHGMNFTLQDILGAVAAFCLFPITLVFPGYVVGRGLDLFDFKKRNFLVRLGIGLVLSFAISPIVLQLTSSLLSYDFSLLLLTGIAAAFVIIILNDKSLSIPGINRSLTPFFWIAIAWVVFAILSLINIQWSDHLFLSVTSFDQTTRVSIIEAMTRTGIPPIDPSYYPGHPVRLTFLYYFWYIPASMVDTIGGQYVDARAALNASSAWAGLGMMTVVALYLRQRNANHDESVWRSARIGVGLLAVSGLDVIPIVMLMMATGQIVGSIDVWNTWIPSWVASALWVPHHVASLIAGLSAMMLAQSARGRSTSKQFVILSIAGLGFASALGLSIYVTLGFVFFWVLWLVAIFFQKTDHTLILPMIFSGIVAILLASPFLIGLLHRGGSGDAAQFPIVFEIRTFLQLESFVKDWSSFARSVIMLAVLPINYLFELGFFFLAGFYWFRIKDKKAIRSSTFYSAEILLLGVALFIGSCFRSTLITSNDLGWRVWLPGQFILLIWGVDVLETLVFTSRPVLLITAEAKKDMYLLGVFLSIGLLTSVVDAVLLRTAWPIMTGADVTRKYYSARLAYDFLRDHIPADVVTQNNPLNYVDRPSGLYGTHQMAIADRTSYGVPLAAFNKLVSEVGKLFTNKSMTDWQLTDHLCQEYSINVLIIEDTDPIWNGIPALKMQRPPIYENAHYALFACGDYDAPPLAP
ncbi:MAG TPA: hypothetical protein VFI68_14475, partial [Anaerolineales bacterium]|nr:hypothetical protein [Anaerolineales bacterium]